MNNDVFNRINCYFKKYGQLPVDKDILNENYVILNVFSSIEFVKMITDLEIEFNIVFTSQEMEDPKFHTLLGLANIISNKIVLQQEA